MSFLCEYHDIKTVKKIVITSSLPLILVVKVDYLFIFTFLFLFYNVFINL